MSSSLKVISLVSYRKALSTLVSVARHSTPAPEAMLTRASVAILHSLAVSSSCLNKFLNLGLFCKVVMAMASRADLSSSSSPGSAQITTVATPFPLWFRNGFLCTSSQDNSRVPSLILRCTSLWNV